ncbi:TPA: MobA/MobL family protein, partial [Raoultella ornithinolytica]|nr:MobA/MobL family protein [Raoultella ornithinolytica]
KTGSELVTQWRERFAELTNERLQENGITARVDHRTLEAQGIDREPTQHLGPSATAIERRTGQASSKRQDYQQAAASLAATGAQAEQRRIESMNSAELAAEIKRLTPHPVSDLVKQDQSVANASRATYQLMTRETDASIAESRIAREIADWREAHKVQVWAHDKGIKVAPELRELEERQAAHRAEYESLRLLIEDAKRHERTTREEAEKRIKAEQKPVFAKIFELKTALREKARDESKQSTPQPVELKPEPKQQTRAELLDEFAKAHAERGLYFNRDYEQGEIQALQPDKAREYLQSALEARTERQQASEQDRGFEL